MPYIPQSAPAVKTLDVTNEVPPEEKKLVGLARAYQIEKELKSLKNQMKDLESERAGIIEGAIKANELSQDDEMGNCYELKDKGRSVRTLDLDLLWKNHPDAFRQIVKNAEWKVDPFAAMEALTEAEIESCKVFSPITMGILYPDAFNKIATPKGGSALVGDAQKVLGESQIDACSTMKISPKWELTYVPRERESLGKKAKGTKP